MLATNRLTSGTSEFQQLAAALLHDAKEKLSASCNRVETDFIHAAIAHVKSAQTTLETAGDKGQDHLNAAEKLMWLSADVRRLARRQSQTQNRKDQEMGVTRF